MKQLLSILFSNKLTLIVLLLFAVAMGYATFMENDFGTATAHQMIYGAWWFELLMAILALNFIGNIYRYKLLRKEKVSILVFHLAFIVILVGAFVTRYFGQEGLTRIREGQETDHVISQERYFSINANNRTDIWEFNDELELGRFKQPDLNLRVAVGQSNFKVVVNRFVPDAVQQITSSNHEDEVVEIIASTGHGRNSFYLAKGGSLFLNGQELTFDNPKHNAINLSKEKGGYWIESQAELSYMVMSTQQTGILVKNNVDSLRLRALYRSHDLSFVITKIHEGAKLTYETTDDKDMAQNAADLLFITLEGPKNRKEIMLAALDGVANPVQTAKLDDIDFQLSYGPRLLKLPFILTLKDFQLERYPGSTSPSSYASELVVDEGSKAFPYRISMNNVLDYQGYRFFQASYDTDELGTVLSVSQDYWGTRITYLGYFLMGIGMILTFFGKRSRFYEVSKKLKGLRLEKTLTCFFLISVLSYSASYASVEEVEEPVPATYIDANHAEAFGQILVQDMDGRLKPINTLASEFLRKLTRKTNFTLDESGQLDKMNSNQVFLSIHQNPQFWQHVRLIKVDTKKMTSVLKMLKLEGKSFLSFRDLVDDDGQYRMQKYVEGAQRKKPSERSETDKEIITVDERFNILYQALTGNYLKIFPQPNDPAQKWLNSEFSNAGFKELDSVFVRNILSAYYSDIRQAQKTNDWTVADDKLTYVKTFQEVMGRAIVPSESRRKAEILYNKLNIFNRLFPVYWILGIYLLALAVARVFYNGTLLTKAQKIGVISVMIAFALQTGNMILRWYAGGYPPWSNGYEMIILVAWALFLFAFIFNRKSDFILPLAALFGGTLLFVSFLDWLNPEITNLVPVLKSYWLKIHVAIIVSSYAPLALSALLGILSLIFMTTRNERFKNPIAELTYINELSMTIGLFMLAIGTFLGGIWANESWGRYWGWDPKETWALISIIVYAVVLHLRFIPALRSRYTFNMASIIAFFSIIMTSFGVNYYLSGLHSYAAGDPVPVPKFVYWVVGSIILLGVLAFISQKKKLSKV